MPEYLRIRSALAVSNVMELEEVLVVLTVMSGSYGSPSASLGCIAKLSDP